MGGGAGAYPKQAIHALLLAVGIGGGSLLEIHGRAAPASPRVVIVDLERVRPLPPAEERETTGRPEEEPARGREFQTRVSWKTGFEDPYFLIEARDPGDPPGRLGGPGILGVRVVLDPEEAKRRKVPSLLWYWQAPERYRARWSRSSESVQRDGQTHERYLGIATFDPKWKETPTVLLFDAQAAPEPGGKSRPVYEVELPTEAFYTAAPEQNLPRFRRRDTSYVVAWDRWRAEISVMSDGERALVWLQPFPETDKSGFWLLDGQGQVLKTLVFPGRTVLASGLPGPVLRSRNRRWWAVTLARPALEAELGLPLGVAGASQPHPYLEAQVVAETYLIDREGNVAGRLVNRDGRDMRLGYGGWDFSLNDRWAYGVYRSPGDTGGRMTGCYYDLAALPGYPARGQ